MSLLQVGILSVGPGIVLVVLLVPEGLELMSAVVLVVAEEMSVKQYHLMLFEA